MNIKLTAVTLASLALITTAIYKYQLSTEPVRPSNLDVCTIEFYPLFFEDLTFDNYVKPGQQVSFDANFMPLIDTVVDYVSIAGYQNGKVVYLLKNEDKVDIKGFDDFHYKMKVDVPGDVPKGVYNMEMNWFDKDLKTLACVKFGLSF